MLEEVSAGGASRTTKKMPKRSATKERCVWCDGVSVEVFDKIVNYPIRCQLVAEAMKAAAWVRPYIVWRIARCIRNLALTSLRRTRRDLHETSRLTTCAIMYRVSVSIKSVWKGKSTSGGSLPFSIALSLTWKRMCGRAQKHGWKTPSVLKSP